MFGSTTCDSLEPNKTQVPHALAQIKAPGGKLKSVPVSNREDIPVNSWFPCSQGSEANTPESNPCSTQDSSNITENNNLHGASVDQWSLSGEWDRGISQGGNERHQANVNMNVLKLCWLITEACCLETWVWPSSVLIRVWAYVHHPKKAPFAQASTSIWILKLCTDTWIYPSISHVFFNSSPYKFFKELCLNPAIRRQRQVELGVLSQPGMYSEFQDS